MREHGLAQSEADYLAFREIESNVRNESGQ
jgi:hypothetical protein